MPSLWVAILTLALHAGAFEQKASSAPELRQSFEVETQRVVSGSVVDASRTYESGQPITVIHILEFSANLFPMEPKPLRLRLCGNQNNEIQSAIHTNITLVYRPVSHSRLTGCVALVKIVPYIDNGAWRAIRLGSSTEKWSIQHEKATHRPLGSFSTN
jgi:hypothetical protein